MTAEEATRGINHPAWSREVRIALWIAQTLLALVFGLTGAMRIGISAAAVARTWRWPGAVPGMPVRLIGVLELAGGIGVVLPPLLGRGPSLTPVVATGLVAAMAYTNIFLFWRGDVPMLLINLALGALAAFVAWTRFGKTPLK
jgi:hypothetical protein